MGSVHMPIEAELGRMMMVKGVFMKTVVPSFPSTNQTRQIDWGRHLSIQTTESRPETSECRQENRLARLF
jgi:hypothetical protein